MRCANRSRQDVHFAWVVLAKPKSFEVQVSSDGSQAKDSWLIAIVRSDQQKHPADSFPDPRRQQQLVRSLVPAPVHSRTSAE